MRSGYFQRWTHDPVWLVNVGGAAVLGYTRLEYSRNPRPSKTKFQLGESFVSFPHIDYLFTDAPRSIRMDDASKPVIKMELKRIDEEPGGALMHLMDDADPPRLLRFAECHLADRPGQERLVRQYLQLAARQHQDDRAREFLKGGLSRRPVDVAWHRANTYLKNRDQEVAGLVAEYDAALKKEPTSAALLYLRGRIANERSDAVAYVRRAVDADPKFSWGWYALAYDAAARGDWQQSRSYAEQVWKLNARDDTWSEFWHIVRLATGEAASLEREYQELVARSAPEEVMLPLVNLCDALACQGKPHKGRDVLAEWERRIPPEVREAASAQTVVREFLALCRYTLGDLKEAIDDLDARGKPALLRGRVHLLLALGRAAEAAKEPVVVGSLSGDSLTALSLSVGLGDAGDEASAIVWRSSACRALEKDPSRGMKQAGRMLAAAKAPTRQQFDDLVMSNEHKALVALALAQRFPAERSWLFPYARKLNVSRRPPYYLVDRLTRPAQ
jgi:hypothetical protein